MRSVRRSPFARKRVHRPCRHPSVVLGTGRPSFLADAPPGSTVRVREQIEPALGPGRVDDPALTTLDARAAIGEPDESRISPCRPQPATRTVLRWRSSARMTGGRHRKRDASIDDQERPGACTPALGRRLRVTRAAPSFSAAEPTGRILTAMGAFAPVEARTASPDGATGLAARSGSPCMGGQAEPIGARGWLRPGSAAQIGPSVLRGRTAPSLAGDRGGGEAGPARSGPGTSGARPGRSRRRRRHLRRAP